MPIQWPGSWTWIRSTGHSLWNTRTMCKRWQQKGQGIIQTFFQLDIQNNNVLHLRQKISDGPSKEACSPNAVQSVYRLEEADGDIVVQERARQMKWWWPPTVRSSLISPVTSTCPGEQAWCPYNLLYCKPMSKSPPFLRHQNCVLEVVVHTILRCFQNETDQEEETD